MKTWEFRLWLARRFLLPHMCVSTDPRRCTQYALVRLPPNGKFVGRLRCRLLDGHNGSHLTVERDLVCEWDEV